MKIEGGPENTNGTRVYFVAKNLRVQCSIKKTKRQRTRGEEIKGGMKITLYLNGG